MGEIRVAAVNAFNQNIEPLTVAFCCPQDGLWYRIRRTLPPLILDRRTGSWDAFLRAVSGADCAVIAFPTLGVQSRVVRLVALCRQYPHLPVVLITRRDADQLKRVSHLRIESVVWVSELEGSLTGAVQEARSATVFAQLSEEIASRADLPLAFRKILVAACHGKGTINSVNQLAKLMNRDRKTIWYHWRKATEDRETIHLKEFLDWLRVVRARELAVTGHYGAVIGNQLNTSARSLQRQIRRLTGLSLSELAVCKRAYVWEQFGAALEGTTLEGVCRLP